MLGHSQTRTMMDICSHVMPALAREAADRMGALLRTGQGQLQPQTTQAVLPRENGRVRGVELRGLEPLTPHCQAVVIAFTSVRHCSISRVTSG